MSSNRYVIRNCPANYQDNCRTAKVKECNCQDCTNCIMKQIVELCKRDKNFCINCKAKADDNIDCIECIEGGRAELGAEILKLLDIEEIE